MGANASTAVPLYASGQVLDAARLNLTNSGIPVFSGTATRDAAFGGSGEKVLAEGQFAYLEDTNAVQYYDGAAFQPVGVAPGLVLIKTETIGTTVSSVTVSGAFSATYDNYNIVITGGVGSTNSDLALTLGASVTGYFAAYSYVNIGTSATAIVTNNNASSFSRIGQATATQISANLWLQNPFAAATTMLQGAFGRTVADNVASYVGGHSVASSFTAFTLTPSTGTLTGGTIRVYGYANS